MQMQLCATCLFGIESIVGDELKRMGMPDVRVENGRVLFSGGERELAMANVRLRTAERIMVLAGEFKALSFDELFEGVKALPWENYIPTSGQFPVKGHCLSSQLHSVPDCQAIIKKAVADRLSSKYKINWFDENGAKFQIRFTLIKDTASVYIDSSGVGLHKRGYRAVGNVAPLRETLAAAMVNLARFRGKGDFADPFCGSGTIAIEAAMAAVNRAPGIMRKFAAMDWVWIKSNIWKDVRDEAKSLEYTGRYSIWGGDIDPKSIEIARSNALKAGISEHVCFEVADATAFARETAGGVIVTNPPYGERIMEKQDAEHLYREFGAALCKLDNWKLCLLSSHTEFERTFGKVAAKKRKLYNGMLKCDLYMYNEVKQSTGKD